MSESILATLILTSELLISYAYVIFVRSDFVSLKESLNNQLTKNAQNYN